MTTPSEHTKTITWVDPRPQAARALTMSGLDYLRAAWPLLTGEDPPAT